jgi:tetratricopeptide (TPR) repeat protein
MKTLKIIIDDKAIRIKPKYEKAWLNKGMTLSELEKYNDAIKCFDEAIRIDPEDSAARHNRDIALSHLKD